MRNSMKILIQLLLQLVLVPTFVYCQVSIVPDKPSVEISLNGKVIDSLSICKSDVHSIDLRAKVLNGGGDPNVYTYRWFIMRPEKAIEQASDMFKDIYTFFPNKEEAMNIKVIVSNVDGSSITYNKQIPITIYSLPELRLDQTNYSVYQGQNLEVNISSSNFDNNRIKSIVWQIQDNGIWNAIPNTEIILDNSNKLRLDLLNIRKNRYNDKRIRAVVNIKCGEAYNDLTTNDAIIKVKTYQSRVYLNDNIDNIESLVFDSIDKIERVITNPRTVLVNTSISDPSPVKSRTSILLTLQDETGAPQTLNKLVKSEKIDLTIIIKQDGVAGKDYKFDLEDMLSKQETRSWLGLAKSIEQFLSNNYSNGQIFEVKIQSSFFSEITFKIKYNNPNDEITVGIFTSDDPAKIEIFKKNPDDPSIAIPLSTSSEKSLPPIYESNKRLYFFIKKLDAFKEIKKDDTLRYTFQINYISTSGEHKTETITQNNFSYCNETGCKTKAIIIDLNDVLIKAMHGEVFEMIISINGTSLVRYGRFVKNFIGYETWKPFSEIPIGLWIPILLTGTDFKSVENDGVPVVSIPINLAIGTKYYFKNDNSKLYLGLSGLIGYSTISIQDKSTANAFDNHVLTSLKSLSYGLLFDLASYAQIGFANRLVFGVEQKNEDGSVIKNKDGSANLTTLKNTFFIFSVNSSLINELLK